MDTKTPRKSLITLVKIYAMDHYDEGGWDVIVECWDDDQIDEEIGRARSLEGAIRKLRPIVGAYSDREADAINSAFLFFRKVWLTTATMPSPSFVDMGEIEED